MTSLPTAAFVSPFPVHFLSLIFPLLHFFRFNKQDFYSLCIHCVDVCSLYQGLFLFFLFLYSSFPVSPLSFFNLYIFSVSRVRSMKHDFLLFLLLFVFSYLSILSSLLSFLFSSSFSFYAHFIIIFYPPLVSSSSSSASILLLFIFFHPPSSLSFLLFLTFSTLLPLHLFLFCPSSTPQLFLKSILSSLNLLLNYF